MRNIFKIIIPFFIIPLIVISGAVIFDSQKHIIISLGVAIFSLILFSISFEKKFSGTKRMVLISIMTALCLAGRFIPILKPVSALIIITGLWLKAEAGFLVGALSALISNFYFGQGPWTSFQMLALGMIGLFAGIFSKYLKQNKIMLIIYGLICGISYSFIMDIWTVLWYAKGFSLELYGTAIITAVPYTISYSLANIIYLWFLEKPFGEKFHRITVKYRI